MKNTIARPILSLRKRVCFTITVFLLLGAVTELTARAVDAWTDISVEELNGIYQKRRDWRLGNSWPLQRGDYPYLPYIPNHDYPEVNELGFKGRSFSAKKPPNTYRIFCLGGSTTWNGYPAYLETALHNDFAAAGVELEVINAGNQCWTSLESLINFITRCLPLEPDAIVVYHAINDAVYTFSDDYYSDYSHVRRRFEKDDPLIWDYMPAWLDYSAAYVGFRAALERNVGTRAIQIKIAKDVRPGSKRSYHGMKSFQEHIYSLASLAQARGIEVFLTTQLFNRQYKKLSYLQQQWGDAVDDANAITRAFDKLGTGVHILDAATTLPANNNWMIDYCHFTEKGKERLAYFLAGGIKPHVTTMISNRRQTSDLAAALVSTSHPTFFPSVCRRLDVSVAQGRRTNH